VSGNAENSDKSLGGQGSAPNPSGELTTLRKPLMWSETIGLRTRPVCLRPKNWSWSWSWSYMLWSWSCKVLFGVVKYNLVTLVTIMILEDTAAFQVSTVRSTVAFTYLKV